MSILAPLSMTLLLLLGHGVLWVQLWNHTHGRGWPKRTIKRLSQAILCLFVAVPAWLIWAGGLDVLGWGTPQPTPAFWGALAYQVLCMGVALIGVPHSIWRQRRANQSPSLRRQRRSLQFPNGSRNLEPWAESPRSRFLRRLPGNQAYSFEVNQKHVELPGLPPELHGMTIAHLSDLHFTGCVNRQFFREAVARVQEMRADMIVVTGDLVDRRECLPWVTEILGPLNAPHGVYSILGNHDCKVDLAQLRSAIREAGMTDLGGRCLELEVNGYPVLLAGNELPWIKPAPDVAAFLRSRRAADDGPQPFRILLAHSPDQFSWACRQPFDLMLAGHTHGGQIRFGALGPLVCPLRSSLHRSTGTYSQGPTVAHVSRGLSSELPLRYFCRPEVSCLTLLSPAEAGQTVANEHDDSVGIHEPADPLYQGLAPSNCREDSRLLIRP